MKQQDLINNLKDHADFERQLYAFEKILNEREDKINRTEAALLNWHNSLDSKAEVLHCWEQALKNWQQRLTIHTSNN